MVTFCDNGKDQSLEKAIVDFACSSVSVELRQNSKTKDIVDSCLGDRDLWKAFRNHGEAVDVFIPKKRNHNGVRFGFVQVRSHMDARRMIDRTNRFHLFGPTIKVSFARDEVCSTFLKPKHDFEQASGGSKIKMKRLGVSSQSGR
ncbi:hypothetical protein V6N13_126181 [Hibiscus sabdariffa]